MKSIRIDTETRLAQDEVPEVSDMARHKLEQDLCNSTYLGDYTRPGWLGPLPFYAFNCKIHGIVVDYQQGYLKELRCPKCEPHWSWK